jgi:hypothetical protein
MKRFAQALAHVSAADLEAQTRRLDFQILKLDRRREHITPPEAQRATELKKLRLAYKDLLAQSRINTLS